MPTASPLGGLTKPLDSDPLADVYNYIRGIVDKIDGFRLRKPLDQQVTNSSVLTNDADLAFPVEANKVYLFDIMLLYVSNVTTSDLKTGFTFPAGATLSYGVQGADPAASGVISSESNVGVPVAVSGTAHTSFGALTTDLCAQLSGTIKVGATAGTVRLQWAQVTAAAATAVTVRAGSFLRAQIVP